MHVLATNSFLKIVYKKASDRILLTKQATLMVDELADKSILEFYIELCLWNNHVDTEPIRFSTIQSKYYKFAEHTVVSYEATTDQNTNKRSVEIDPGIPTIGWIDTPFEGSYYVVEFDPINLYLGYSSVGNPPEEYIPEATKLLIIGT